MEIFKLFGSIFIDNEKADKSIDGTESKAEKLGKTLKKGAGTIKKWGLGLGIATAAGVAGMIKLASDTGNAADRLLDLSSITGMSTDELQKWERVSTVAGVSADAMSNVSQKLTKQMDILATGTGKASEAADELGLSYEDLDAMNADQRMNALVSALQGVEDPTERARLGTDLLGGSWKELAPVLDVGADRLKEVKDNANIISNENLNQANEFRINMDQMKERLTVFGQELAVRFIPVLNKMFDWFELNMPTIEKIFTGAVDFITLVTEKLITIINEAFIPALTAIWNWIEPHLPMIQEFFSAAFESIQLMMENVWGFIQDNLLPILGGLFDWISRNMPIFQSIFKIAFDTIWAVIDSVWSILEVTLFPVLKLLFEWIDDKMPIIQTVFETVFSAINSILEFTQGIIEGIITTIEDMVGAIKRGLRFLTGFNKADESNIAENDGRNLRIGARAKGGPITNGNPYLVGELGPELIIPRQSGTVIPNNQLGALSGSPITVGTMVVREEADIQKIARELFNLQRAEARGVGID